MFGILDKLGLGGLFHRKTEVKTVRLDIIAEKVKEFNEAKKEMDTRINSLEERATEIDKNMNETLNMSKVNQERLSRIEDNINRMINMSEKLLKTNAGRATEDANNSVGLGSGQSAKRMEKNAE